MNWDFTPAQVVKGEVAYEIEAFRQDLAKEVAANVAPGDAAQFERAYDLVYDLCYWLATGKPFERLLSAFDGEPETRDWLLAVKPHMRENIDMLGAILQKEIMDGVAGGLPLDRALENVASRHAGLARVQAA